MVSFIHIGKTGGTTLDTILSKHLEQYKTYHLTKNYNNEEKYIIWIRNPISRFVSAFNHASSVINSGLEMTDYNLTNSLSPLRMINKKKGIQKYIYSEAYDNQIKLFDSANDLAESLTSSDFKRKEEAVKLMNMKEEHLFKGIGWYLNNGNFIINRHSRILFIGCQEYMSNDIKRLSEKLGLNLETDIKLRENVYVDSSMKYLSQKAIDNIKDWYKDTDYKALVQIEKYGFISKMTLESYYSYNG